MTASELRELAKTLRHEVPTTPVFTQAAEVLELVAWAEENSVGVERADGWNVFFSGKWYVGDTLIDTLRRAKEAAK